MLEMMKLLSRNRHVLPITHFVIIHLNGQRCVMRQKLMPRLSLLIWHGAVRLSMNYKPLLNKLGKAEAYNKNAI